MSIYSRLFQFWLFHLSNGQFDCFALLIKLLFYLLFYLFMWNFNLVMKHQPKKIFLQRQKIAIIQRTNLTTADFFPIQIQHWQKRETSLIGFHAFSFVCLSTISYNGNLSFLPSTARKDFLIFEFYPKRRIWRWQLHSKRALNHKSPHLLNSEIVRFLISSILNTTSYKNDTSIKILTYMLFKNVRLPHKIFKEYFILRINI